MVSDERGGHYDPRLLREPAKRKTAKSPFLRKLEKMQEEARAMQIEDDEKIIEFDRKKR